MSKFMRDNRYSFVGVRVNAADSAIQTDFLLEGAPHYYDNDNKAIKAATDLLNSNNNLGYKPSSCFKTWRKGEAKLPR